MDTIQIKVKKIDERAVIPSYAKNGDAAMDITATDVEYDEKNDMYICHTGLAFEAPQNVVQLAFVRSSNCKTDAYLCNHVGVIDSGYRGEVQFRFKNRTSLESMITSHFAKDLVNILSSGNRYIQTIGKVKQDFLERARKLEFSPYKPGDRIGQVIFIPYPTVEIKEVTELSDSDRGEGGFGSTGK